MSGSSDEPQRCLRKGVLREMLQPRLAKVRAINHGLLLPLKHFFSTVPISGLCHLLLLVCGDEVLEVRAGPSKFLRLQGGSYLSSIGIKAQDW